MISNAHSCHELHFLLKCCNPFCEILFLLHTAFQVSLYDCCLQCCLLNSMFAELTKACRFREQLQERCCSPALAAASMLTLLVAGATRPRPYLLKAFLSMLKDIIHLTQQGRRLFHCAGAAALTFCSSRHLHRRSRNCYGFRHPRGIQWLGRQHPAPSPCIAYAWARTSRPTPVHGHVHRSVVLLASSHFPVCFSATFSLGGVRWQGSIDSRCA